jgi:hypothetical protein
MGTLSVVKEAGESIPVADVSVEAPATRGPGSPPPTT